MSDPKIDIQPWEMLGSQAELKAARQKYRLLGQEIGNLPSGNDRDNLIHTHSKLGLFLAEALGSRWGKEEGETA